MLHNFSKKYSFKNIHLKQKPLLVLLFSLFSLCLNSFDKVQDNFFHTMPQPIKQISLLEAFEEFHS